MYVCVSWFCTAHLHHSLHQKQIETECAKIEQQIAMDREGVSLGVLRAAQRSSALEHERAVASRELEAFSAEKQAEMETYVPRSVSQTFTFS